MLDSFVGTMATALSLPAFRANPLELVTCDESSREAAVGTPKSCKREREEARHVVEITVKGQERQVVPQA